MNKVWCVYNGDERVEKIFSTESGALAYLDKYHCYDRDAVVASCSLCDQTAEEIKDEYAIYHIQVAYKENAYEVKYAYPVYKELQINEENPLMFVKTYKSTDEYYVIVCAKNKDEAIQMIKAAIVEQRAKDKNG